MYRAVRPALLTTKGLLIGISSPYRKIGLLYQKHRDHFGVDGNILVVQGSTALFNPTISAAELEEERALDPTAAISEWDALFRNDLNGYLDDESIDRAIDYDRPLELPPQEGVIYEAFVDANAGGSDAYGACVAHKMGDDYIIDAVHGTYRGDPQVTTKEYADLFRSYRITKVTGDNFAKEWVAGAWRKLGFEYFQSKKVKSDIYLECIPLWLRGAVHIPNLRLSVSFACWNGRRIEAVRTPSPIREASMTTTLTPCAALYGCCRKKLCGPRNRSSCRLSPRAPRATYRAAQCTRAPPSRLQHGPVSILCRKRHLHFLPLRGRPPDGCTAPMAPSSGIRRRRIRPSSRSRAGLRKCRWTAPTLPRFLPMCLRNRAAPIAKVAMRDFASGVVRHGDSND
jgi:hypothetical protein